MTRRDYCPTVEEFSIEMADEGFALLGGCCKYKDGIRMSDDEIKDYVVAHQDEYKEGWDKRSGLVKKYFGNDRFSGPAAELFGNITKEDLKVVWRLDYEGVRLQDTPRVFVYCRAKSFEG